MFHKLSIFSKCAVPNVHYLHTMTLTLVSLHLHTDEKFKYCSLNHFRLLEGFFCHSSSVLYLLLTAHRIQQPISKLQVRDFTNFLTNYNKFYKSLFGNGFFVRNNLTGVNNSWKFRISSRTSSQLICTQTKIWILFVESLSVARFFYLLIQPIIFTVKVALQC